MRYALSDIGKSLGDVRLWSFFAFKQLQLKYRRNVLGMFWVVLSYTVPALGIGWLMAKLQGAPLDQHIPHVAFGLAAWNFMVKCATEGAGALTRNRGMLLQAPIPRTVFSVSFVAGAVIVLIIEFLTACLISAAFGWRPGPTLVFLPLSLLVFIIAGMGTVLFVSLVSARLRDFAEGLASVFRIAFFFTPIIWSAQTRSLSTGDSDILSRIAQYNPLTYFVELLRMPAQGDYPTILVLSLTSGMTLALVIAGLIVLQRGGRSIAFFV